MNQPYFTLEFAHSINGHLKRIHITRRTLKFCLAGTGLLAIFVTALLSGCLWMSWRVANYNKLLSDFDHLRHRYKDLQLASKQRGEQMASLENLASEVSSAYGLNKSVPTIESGPLDSDDSSEPSAKESIEQFNFLKSASYTGIFHRYAHQWQTHAQPSAWPLIGGLRSSFGERSDPFSGEGAFHTGIDLSAVTGSSVRATADGVVSHAGWSGRYGKLVVIDHGNGVQTYYAHLSEFLVVPGEDVRLGEVIALSGGTGRVTSPHLHYEVRIAGTPVNPYRYLTKTRVAQGTKPPHNDLGF
jgi:murein DD-endopeptidase MepM/ murein hydrolase activator NlpD